MIRLLNQLNLRPQERRLVVGAATVLFVVLNLWFVWPHYGKLGRVRAQLDQAGRTLRTYQAELLHTNQYLASLRALEKQGGAVPDAEKNIALQSTIQTLAQQHGVSYGSIPPPAGDPRGKTNAFFEQRTLRFDMNPTAPESLVDFLVAVAANDLVIRVKELDLKCDQTRTRLQGKVTLAASFQKKSPTRTGPTKPGARPAPKS